MFISEFQDIRSGRLFGRTAHPDRSTAERYATEKLIAMGESPEDVARTMELAGWTCADTRAHGYGVRIFEAD